MIETKNINRLETINVPKVGTKFTMVANGESFSAIMDSIYPDRVTSALTELSVNAVDSHRQAGESRPFEVWLPTHFSPTFKIRDFGTSMPADFMESKGEWSGRGYTVAFESTKRDSNIVDGAKGLGRLTAFCLSDFFTVTCFLNGELRTYSVFRDESGVPDIRLQFSGPTKEPNGVLIEIPVKEGHIANFESAAKNVFRYFPAEARPKIVSHPDLKIPKEEYIFGGRESGFGVCGCNVPPKAIMGSYCYPLDENFIPGLSDGQKSLLRSGAVLFFNIGDLCVQTNRNGLFYNEKTVGAIKEKLDFALSKMKEELSKALRDRSAYERLVLSQSFCSGSSLFYLRTFLEGVFKEFGGRVGDIPLPCYGIDGVRYYRPYSYVKVKGRKAYCLPGGEKDVVYFSRKRSYLKLKAKKFFEDSSNFGKNLIFLILGEDSDLKTFEQKFGFDPTKIFKDAEELPFDKPVKSGGSMALLPKDEVFVVDVGNITPDGLYKFWKPQSVPLPSQGEKVVYLVRSGRGLRGADNKGHSSASIRRMILDCRNFSDGKNLVIYGLTKTQLKEKGANWIHFSDFYSEALKSYRKKNEEAASKVKYFSIHYANFTSIFYLFGVLVEKGMLPQDSYCAKVYREYKELLKISSTLDYSKAGVYSKETPISKSCIGGTEGIIKRYPLLGIFPHFASPSQLSIEAAQDLANYINSKDLKKNN